MSDFFDSFTSASAEDLSAHIPDTGTAWTLQSGNSSDLSVVGGAVKPRNTNLAFFTSDELSDPDCYVQAKINLLDAAKSSNDSYVVLRAQDANNFIGFRIAGTGAAGVQLVVKQAGVDTALVTMQGVDNAIFRLEAEGDVVRFYMNGVQSGADQTVTTFNTLTKQGLVAEDNVGGSDWLDSYEAGTIGSGGGNSIQVTSPANNSCLQADQNGQATFPVTGIATGATSIEISYDGGSNWSVFDAAPNGGWSGNALVTGQQDLMFRLGNDTAVETTVSNVTAAMCIPCWWQSNMSGRGTNLQPITVTGNNPTPIMFKNGSFSALVDPTGIEGTSAGSTLPRIAQQYSDAGIPVCFANVAIGATGTADWQKGGSKYQAITDFVTAVGGAAFTLSIGGERNSVLETPQATIESELNQIVNDLNADFGTKHYLVYFPGGDGISQPTAPVYAAFDNVIASNANCEFGGDLRVIDIDIATTSGNDGVHIKSDADITQAASIIYSALTAQASTFTITGTDFPDGTFSFDFYDRTSLPMSHIETKDMTFLNGDNIPLELNVTPSTPVIGLSDGPTPLTTGKCTYGVTT